MIILALKMLWTAPLDINDLGANRISTHALPIGVLLGATTGSAGVQYKNEGVDVGTPSSVKNVDIVGEDVSATFAGETLTITTAPVGSKGFIAITDITPTSTGSVGTKVRPVNDDTLLTSCLSSTTDVTVQVVAVTGKTSFKPTGTINGIEAVFTRNGTSDTWTGIAAITLSGDAPYTITATHGDGYEATATVEFEETPIITSFTFSGAYPVEGQTEHAAGQTVILNVSCDTNFDAYEVIFTAGETATVATSQYDFEPGGSTSIEVAIADQGSYGTGAPLVLPAKIRVRSVNGTWSAITSSAATGGVNGVNILALNNTRPIVVATGITYPATQFALKGTEEATVAATYANVDSVLWESASQLTVSAPTVQGNVVVNRLAGGYNIGTTNLTATAQRVANATTSTTNVVVWIADTNPVITKTLPAARLRSGVSVQNHVITLGSDQRLISIAMNAGTILGDAAGTFSGSWATANNGLTNTRTLVVADSDPKGTATFTGLSAINLAGKEVTAVSTNLDYVLGGFVTRTVSFPLWDGSATRITGIGTDVLDTSKLVVFNISKNSAALYRGTVGDEVDKITVTNSNELYNCDLPNASSALESPVTMTIEETV